MKQIIQDIRSGDTILEEVPVPKVSRGKLVIQTTRSLVSLGTERMLAEFGKSNLIQKARKQPDKLKQVFDKIKTDGLIKSIFQADQKVLNCLGYDRNNSSRDFRKNRKND